MLDDIEINKNVYSLCYNFIYKVNFSLSYYRFGTLPEVMLLRPTDKKVFWGKRGDMQPIKTMYTIS